MFDADAISRLRQKRRVYYPPRLKRLVLGLASLSLAMAFLLALISGGKDQNAGFTYTLLAGLLFFGGAGAVILYRLARLKPVVLMDANGLTVWVGAGRPKHVNWDSITGLHLLPAPRMRVLGIATGISRTGWTDKALFWRTGNQSFSAAELAIPSVSVAASLRKVEAEIRRRVPLQ